MQTYAELFLKIKTLQLASIITAFDVFCMRKLKSSPLHDPTMASYANNVCYSISNEKFEFVKSEEIIEFIQRGIRGGIETSNIKLVKSNSERLHQFDGVAANRHEILYIDLNGIYGKCLTEPMAQSSYRWLGSTEIHELKLNDLPQGYGFILEVDLEYPTYCHSDHDDLPMAVEKNTQSLATLSQKQLKCFSGISQQVKMPIGKYRMSLNLNAKTNYVVYHKNLIYYLAKGLILKKIHKVLTFKEESFFKKPMDELSRIKLECIRNGDILWAGIMKQMICSIYGYLLANSRDHSNIQLCTSKVECLKLSSRHTFKSVHIINDHLSMFQMNKGSIKFKNAIICGFTVLELIKLHLYRGYDMIREKFPTAKLIFAQTDSLCIAIKDPEKRYLENLKALGPHFDFSNLPKYHYLHSLENQSTPGKWKIVDMNILEVISCRIKQYSYISACPDCMNEFSADCKSCNQNQSGKLCAPGIPRAVLNRTNHDFFRQLLSSEGVTKLSVSIDWNLAPCSYKFHSLNLSRVLDKDGIHSKAIGNVCLRDKSNCI